ncbi:P-loop containing nucleoside triphosphate hydrolase protein [Zychaea mexicana]|uniref:P-loop containing nucleoside triphosphate hydrolase protein n=1 Tax=Zychaea mexicana TaxID=64656 RepID=UPI0022FE3987|nr:P-loop containing nucleoside triphosphate hydrolase protein [Zychaea mexicana]KAI9492941.1 P-loop containing nucleoside triphosphate hydrolase protein [Zychaea mexicana]
MAVPTTDVAATIADLLKKINTAPTSEECDEVARQLAKIVKDGGLILLKHHGILDKLNSAARNKKSGMEREGALIGFNALTDVLGNSGVPLLLQYLGLFLDLYADKGTVVQEAAQMASETLVNAVRPEAAHILLPILYDGMGHNGSKKWQTKLGALQLLDKYTKRSPEQIGECLPQIIPVVSNCLSDTKAEVANAAQKTMMAVCAVGGNPDIEKHLKDLVRCMGDPTRVPKTIEKLAATTFVAEVNGPTLAIMVPLLTRALNERSTLVMRQTVIIIDNLCKLVRDPRTAAQFLPQLYPGVNYQAESASFPEIRELAGHAKQTLIDAGGAVEQNENADGNGNNNNNGVGAFQVSVEDATKVVRAEATKIQGFLDSFFNPFITYTGAVVADWVRQELYIKDTWADVISDYLNTVLMPRDVPAMCNRVFDHFLNLYKQHGGNTDSSFDDQEGEELCNIQDFSLAYGTRLLLNHTKLKLHRGQRYGLCGENGAGKSTLMRSIDQGKVEEFPSKDQVRTAMVDYAAQGADTSLSVLDYACADPNLKSLSREDVKKGLEDVGFDDERLKVIVNTLSGGWKMKLELARAILFKADILLLDEPTNHLDVHNVKWLQDYLVSQKDVTCLIVSHDPGFLDAVCTQILHYEKKKLRLYSGNLTSFVEQYPPAANYYTLESSTVSFSFPKPSVLQGVRSNTKAILKATDCTFQYPGRDIPSLYNATISLSLSSRVSVLGANGAGKTTLIKLLTGEVVPQTGVVWRHPALRIGYVAQHAFHHLEQHLEKTPMEYLRWRYETGEDKEVSMKETRQISEDEAKQLDKYIDIDGKSRQIEYLIGRAKYKKTFQYEIKWRNERHKNNSWVSREKLLELGFQKLVQQFDDKEASREGLLYRELNVASIRQHFTDIGLDADIAQYSKMGELSGGQKVKVVIAAAMWNNSHMLVLDEPTNFLDRDALGGLANAIKNWEGAVVMISHSDEFTSALCPEAWHLEAGRVSKAGKSAVEDEVQVDDEKVKARISKKKKKTRAQLKDQEARRRARKLKWLIEGGEREPDTDSD